LNFYNFKRREQLKHLVCLKIGEELGELMEEVLSLEKIQRKEKLEGGRIRLATKLRM